MKVPTLRVEILGLDNIQYQFMEARERIATKLRGIADQIEAAEKADMHGKYHGILAGCNDCRNKVVVERDVWDHDEPIFTNARAEFNVETGITISVQLGPARYTLEQLHDIHEAIENESEAWGSSASVDKEGLMLTRLGLICDVGHSSTGRPAERGPRFNDFAAELFNERRWNRMRDVIKATPTLRDGLTVIEVGGDCVLETSE